VPVFGTTGVGRRSALPYRICYLSPPTMMRFSIRTVRASLAPRDTQCYGQRRFVAVSGFDPLFLTVARAALSGAYSHRVACELCLAGAADAGS